jgi:hypothetical protein
MNPSRFPTNTTAGLLGVVALFVTGCESKNKSTTYNVQVDAISKPADTGQAAPAAQSYHIRTHNPQLDEESLRYKEVADYVRTALSGKGMYEAPSLEEADVVIDIDYGMDAPRVKFETVKIPLLVQQPGRFVTESKTVMRRRPDGSTEAVNVDVKVFQPGMPEFRGMQDSVQPIVVYEKHLKVSARVNRETTEGQQPPEVWSVNVSAEDESNELRRYMPILASATSDYIGTNTREAKPITIQEGDEVVTFIKKGL